MIRERKLIKLLNKDCETLYWIGFLLADGYFTKGGIGITLSVLDINHLEKLKTFLGFGNIKIYEKPTGNMCRIVLSDTKSQNLIIKKYGDWFHKTINAPDISKYKITKDQLFSLIIGFFDGDGHIETRRGYSCGRIKVHNSWKYNLEFMEKFWFKYLDANYKGKITFARKNSYAILNFNPNSMYKAKCKIVKLNLPILERKWNKIIKPKNKSKLSRTQVKNIRNSLLPFYTLSKKYCVSISTIYSIKNIKTHRGVL